MASPSSPRARKKSAKALAAAESSASASAVTSAVTAAMSVGVAEDDAPLSSLSAATVATAESSPRSTSSGKPSKPTLSRSQSSGSAGSSHRRSSSSSNGGGKGKKCALGTSTVEYLKVWMMSPEHVEHPYPTEEEKARIMNDTGIELKQLTNWFVNNRKRYWKPRVEELRKNGGLASESSNASANEGSNASSSSSSAVASTPSSKHVVSSSEEDDCHVNVNAASRPNKHKRRRLLVTSESSSTTACSVSPPLSPKLTYSVIAGNGGEVGVLHHSDGSATIAATSNAPHTRQVVVTPDAVTSEPTPAAATTATIATLPPLLSVADPLTDKTPLLPRQSSSLVLAPPPVVGDFAHSCNEWKMDNYTQPCALCSACRDWNLGEFCPWDLALLDDDNDYKDNHENNHKQSSDGSVGGGAYSNGDGASTSSSNASVTGSTASASNVVSDATPFWGGNDSSESSVNSSLPLLVSPKKYGLLERKASFSTVCSISASMVDHEISSWE